MPYLVHKDRDGSVIQFWNLHDGATTVGRGDEANAKVEDQLLSRKHFTISKDTAGFTLKDLGSKNGTKVNGQGVTEHVLKTNDRIHAGESMFTFTDGLTTMAGKMDKVLNQLGQLAPESKPSTPK